MGKAWQWVSRPNEVPLSSGPLLSKRLSATPPNDQHGLVLVLLRRFYGGRTERQELPDGTQGRIKGEPHSGRPHGP